MSGTCRRSSSRVAHAGRGSLVSPAFSYTASHHASFSTRGFVTFPRFLRADALVALRSAADRVYQAAATKGNIDGEWIEQLHQTLPAHNNWVWGIASDPSVLAMMRTHLGPDLVLYSAQLAIKPPRGGRVVPLHQDGGQDCRTLWVTLDDVDEASGGMVVVPGCHHQRYPLRLIDPDAPDAIAQYEATMFNGSHHVYEISRSAVVRAAHGQARSHVPAPDAGSPTAAGDNNKSPGACWSAYKLPAGAAAVHHPLLPHCSYPNRTAHRWRRVLILRYQPARSRNAFDRMPAWTRHWQSHRLFLKRSYLLCGSLDGVRSERDAADGGIELEPPVPDQLQYRDAEEAVVHGHSGAGPRKRSQKPREPPPARARRRAEKEKSDTSAPPSDGEALLSFWADHVSSARPPKRQRRRMA